MAEAQKLVRALRIELVAAMRAHPAKVEALRVQLEKQLQRLADLGSSEDAR